MYGKVSSINLSMLYTWVILKYQCDHNYLILWLLANPYTCIYDQSKKNQGPVSQNVNFRLNTLLHEALQLYLLILFRRRNQAAAKQSEIREERLWKQHRSTQPGSGCSWLYGEKHLWKWNNMGQIQGMHLDISTGSFKSTTIIRDVRVPLYSGISAIF